MLLMIEASTASSFQSAPSDSAFNFKEAKKRAREATARREGFVHDPPGPGRASWVYILGNTLWFLFRKHVITQKELHRSLQVPAEDVCFQKYCGGGLFGVLIKKDYSILGWCLVFMETPRSIRPS